MREKYYWIRYVKITTQLLLLKTIPPDRGMVFWEKVSFILFKTIPPHPPLKYSESKG